MSDEIRPEPEDEVEAHGLFEKPGSGAETGLEGPQLDATDDEPDVEAHGLLEKPGQYGPGMEGPGMEGPSQE